MEPCGEQEDNGSGGFKIYWPRRGCFYRWQVEAIPALSDEGATVYCCFDGA